MGFMSGEWEGCRKSGRGVWGVYVFEICIV